MLREIRARGFLITSKRRGWQFSYRILGFLTRQLYNPSRVVSIYWLLTLNVWFRTKLSTLELPLHYCRWVINIHRNWQYWKQHKKGKSQVYDTKIDLWQENMISFWNVIYITYLCLLSSSLIAFTSLTIGSTSNTCSWALCWSIQWNTNKDVYWLASVSTTENNASSTRLCLV